jgi:hypothetical protein
VEYFWWVWIVIMLCGGGVASGVRALLDDRHKRKMALIRAEDKRRKALDEAAKPPEPMCGCKHHLAKHDRSGKCHELVQTAVEWDAKRKPVKFEAQQCTCQQYIGPRPLDTFYAEELIDLQEPNPGPRLVEAPKRTKDGAA